MRSQTDLSFDDSDHESDRMSSAADYSDDWIARAASAHNMIRASAAPVDLDAAGLLQPGIVLRDYQKEGVNWMNALFGSNVGGGILADEMGLGKTLQTITFILHVKKTHNENKTSPTLIVVPLSLLENWASEFSKFAASSIVKVFKYFGNKEERAELRMKIEEKSVMTYETLSNDIEFLSRIRWGILVVDEAHRLKNQSSVLHRNLLLLTPSPFKLLLTGTPVQNNLAELEALLSFACPSIFPAGLEESCFQREFGSSHKSESESQASLDKLNQLIKPFMLRREKETVLTLPPMKETVLYTPMTDIQRTLYKSLLTKNMAVFDAGKKAGLMNVQDYLTLKEYSHVRLDGSIRGDERYATVSAFTKSEGPFAFLLSTRAGGVGLNLTAADTVIFFDSDFNPMMDLQAAARAHRIGQTKPVHVIRFLTEGSVEEVIYKRACAKRILSDRVISGGAGEGNTTDLKTPDDLVSVLRFGVSGLLNPDDSRKSVNEQADALMKSFLDKGEAPIEENLAALDSDASIYLFGGVDYKKDESAFLELKKEMKVEDVKPVNKNTEERKRLQAERAAAARESRFKKLGYTSYALSDDLQPVSDYSDEDDDKEDDANYFVLKTGSVTDPFVTNGQKGIIVHIVDDSGNWPPRGVFAALSQLDPSIGDYYGSSHTAKDLDLGSAHVLPNELKVKHGGEVQVCLIVAQKRGRDGSLGEIRFPDLEAGLIKVGNAAKLIGDRQPVTKKVKFADPGELAATPPEQRANGVGEARPDATVQKIAFVYGALSAEVRARVILRIEDDGGVVVPGWDPERVTTVVVADAVEKADMLDGCKSGVVVVTADELLPPDAANAHNIPIADPCVLAIKQVSEVGCSAFEMLESLQRVKDHIAASAYESMRTSGPLRHRTTAPPSTIAAVLAALPRAMLSITLTDGTQDIIAVEMERISAFKGVCCQIGTKVRIKNALLIKRGTLHLRAADVEVLPDVTNSENSTRDEVNAFLETVRVHFEAVAGTRAGVGLADDYVDSATIAVDEAESLFLSEDDPPITASRGRGKAKGQKRGGARSRGGGTRSAPSKMTPSSVYSEGPKPARNMRSDRSHVEKNFSVNNFDDHSTLANQFFPSRQQSPSFSMDPDEDAAYLQALAQFENDSIAQIEMEVEAPQTVAMKKRGRKESDAHFEQETKENVGLSRTKKSNWQPDFFVDDDDVIILDSPPPTSNKVCNNISNSADEIFSKNIVLSPCAEYDFLSTIGSQGTFSVKVSKIF
ncbi:Chromodomain-helicase-DNA-binding protein 1-like [Entophlyctis luteolus]|nr:Chromodomain-helicase-DNA-binding protein 1-like [Entophlyctis luteolus]